ncbi:MAG TPA: hypothetical protein VLE70_13565 [Anaerolineae bacterium]|nr:hypothetical protein [Anaerolineae bacterium]
MTEVQYTINIVLKSVAIGLAVTSIILLVIGLAQLETIVLLLSIGLSALAVASLSETESREAETE